MEGGGETERDYVKKRSHRRSNCDDGGRETSTNYGMTDRKTKSGGQRKENEEERRR